MVDVSAFLPSGNYGSFKMTEPEAMILRVIERSVTVCGPIEPEKEKKKDKGKLRVRTILKPLKASGDQQLRNDFIWLIQ